MPCSSSLRAKSKLNICRYMHIRQIWLNVAADNLAILNCSYFKKKKKYKLFINVLPQHSTCTQLMIKFKKNDGKGN